MDDMTLIENALDGDDQALRILHDRYLQQILNYAYTQTGDYHQAEEITQDIMFKMARSLDQFQGKSSFRTWLFSISRRVVIDHYRKHKKRKTNEFFADEHLKRIGDRGPTVEEQVLQEQMNEHVLNCMQQLPENDRTVLHLRFIEGFSIDDTARVMSKTAASIKSMQTRARKKLLNLVRSEVGVHD